MLIPNKFDGFVRGRRLYPGGGGKGGGSSYPPPDPRLVEAQVKSLGMQDTVMQQLMDTQKEFAPLQKQQMQFGLDTARKAYEQSQQDREYSLGRRDELTKSQDSMIQDAQNYDSEDKREQIAGKALGDLNQSFANTEDQQQRMMASRGVNPNSGAAMALSNQTATAKAIAGAGVMNTARTAAEDKGRALTDRAANALAGFPAMSMSANGQSAGLGASGVGITNAGVGGMTAGLSATGAAAGAMGSNATSAYSAQANFKNAQDQMANANSGSDILGMGAGMAMRYAFSDVNMKTKIGGLRPGKALQMVKDTPVKEWEYKPGSQGDDGGEKHIGPMAQDVNANMGEDAAPGGKKIDLVNLNGINMQATKDLSEKVDMLASQVKRLAVGGLRKGAHA